MRASYWRGLSRKGTSDLHFKRIPLVSVMRIDRSGERGGVASGGREWRPAERQPKARNDDALHQDNGGVKLVRNACNLDTFGGRSNRPF